MSTTTTQTAAQMRIDADVLSEFVSNALTLVHEAKIHFNADEMALRAVDAANVGMINESLAASAAESYDFEGGVIGVNLERLNNILSVADGEFVTLRLDDETRKLEIESGGMEFTVALIDPDSIRKEPDIPDILDNLNARLLVDASELQRARKAAGLCSEHIVIGCDGETFYAEADGDTDNVRIEWEADGDDVGEQSKPGEAESMFSLDYISDALAAIASDTEVVAHFGTEFPLFLDAEFADGAGDLRYMIAPRIETDGGR